MNRWSFSPILPPEVSYLLLWIHRSLPGMEIYFLTNQGEEKISFNGNFRVRGMYPQWWNAIDGKQRALPQYQHQGEITSIPIQLGPLESGFIIFTREKGEEQGESNFPDYKAIKELSGPWEVEFTDPFGRSFTTWCESLMDWSLSSDKRIRYFSGTAVYNMNLDLDESIKGEEIWLNLGDVDAIAGIRVNGRNAGGVWTSPWRLNVSDNLMPGSNHLEIEVANTWLNRLIGDAGLEKDQRETWLALDPIKPGSPLQTSGLLGPVTLETPN